MLNADETREPDITKSGVEVRIRRKVPDSIDLRVKEVRDAIKRITNGKSPGMDGIKVELLKAGKTVVLWW